MTRLEESIFAGMGTLCLFILGWIGQSLISLEDSAHARETLLAENKVIVLQIQTDINEMRHKQDSTNEKLNDIESRLSKAEDTVRYMFKKLEL